MSKRFFNVAEDEQVEDEQTWDEDNWADYRDYVEGVHLVREWDARKAEGNAQYLRPVDGPDE